MNNAAIQPKVKNSEPYMAALVRKIIRRIAQPTAISVKAMAIKYFNMR